MSKTLHITIGPIFPDGLPLDLKIDTKWLAREMLKNAGKPVAKIISDHLCEGFERGMNEAAAINRAYAREFAAGTRRPRPKTAIISEAAKRKIREKQK